MTGLAGGRALAGAPGAVDLVRPEPRGVVGVITPWNDPYPAAAGLIAAALVTGNTVVHKPSERSAAPGARLTELVAGCLPAGVLVLRRGRTPTPVAALAGHPTSTSSRTSAAAPPAPRVRLGLRRPGRRGLTENGGKDALIVDAGVDPAWAAAQVATGAFTNAGQLCTSVERVYLHADVADAVLDELVAAGRGAGRWATRATRRTTLCPLVDERALATVDAHVRGRRAPRGAVLTGGRRPAAGPTAFAPTVLVGLHRRHGGHGAGDLRTGRRRRGRGLVGGGARPRGERAGTASPRRCSPPTTGHALEAIETLEVGTVKVNAVFGGAPGGSADPRRDSGPGAGYGPDLLREMVALKAVHWEPAVTSG